jgi:DNA-binding CsgD family transcriptional regulator
MVQPVAWGLFYLTWLQPSPRPPAPNRTGPYASFLLAAAMMGAVLIRNSALPLLAYLGLAEPARAMPLLFNALKWTALALGVCASGCVLALGKGRGMASPEQKTVSAAGCGAHGSPPAKPPADRKMIARLLGLASVFFFLNSMLEMRLFPLISGAVGAYEPYFPAVVPAVLLLAFLSGRFALFVNGKTGPFLRLLLVPMILLFILLPALHFLNAEYFLFAQVMNSLVSIAHFSVWVIFTTALAELYRGRWFFYACVSAIHLTYIFGYLGPLIGPLIPEGSGFMVLVSALGALLFTLLAFRALFPSLPLLAESAPESPANSLHAIFREHGLSEREAEVAGLMVMEGLSNQQIAERIFRSKFTVEKHVTSIYRKFGVPDRAAFVTKSLFKI